MTGNGIDDGAGLDVGPSVGTGDGTMLAEGLGVGTGDGPEPDERPVERVGLRDRPINGLFA